MEPVSNPREITLHIINEAIDIAMMSIRDQIRSNMDENAMCNGFKLLVDLRHMHEDLIILLNKEEFEDNGPTAS